MCVPRSLCLSDDGFGGNALFATVAIAENEPTGVSLSLPLFLSRLLPFSLARSLSLSRSLSDDAYKGHLLNLLQSLVLKISS